MTPKLGAGSSGSKEWENDVLATPRISHPYPTYPTSMI